MDFLKKATSSVTSGVGSVATGVTSVATTATSTVVDGTKGAVSTVGNVASSSSHSLTSGISSMMPEVPKPTAAVKWVSVTGITFTTVTLLVTVDVHNPYAVPIPIMSINYDMRTVAGARTMAKGVIPSPGTLKASDNTELKVTVHLPFTAFWDIIKDATADWDIDYNLDLGFVFDLPLVPAVTVPYRYSSSVKLPTLQDLMKGKGAKTKEQVAQEAVEAAKKAEVDQKTLADKASSAIAGLKGGLALGG